MTQHIVQPGCYRPLPTPSLLRHVISDILRLDYGQLDQIECLLRTIHNPDTSEIGHRKRSMVLQIKTRGTTREDVPQLCLLLNEIISFGGTTSMRTHLTEDIFLSRYLIDSDFIACTTALSDAGEPIGFQSLGHAKNIPATWGDIATFTKPGIVQRGVGTNLFAHTLPFAQSLGLETINATVRSYNAGGLRYYKKMGFIEYKREPAVPLEGQSSAEMIFHKRDV